MRNTSPLSRGTQVATVQNSTSAVEPLQPPPSPLELEHRAATLSMKLGAVVFFFKVMGKRWGFTKGGCWDFMITYW